MMENSKAKTGGRDDREYPRHAIWPAAEPEPRRARRAGAQPRFERRVRLARRPTARTRQKIADRHAGRAISTVDPVQNSRLVRICLLLAKSRSWRPQITNSFADNFINSNLERRYEASSYARSFLERQIAKVKGELEKSERQLVAYAQQQNIINTGSGEQGRRRQRCQLARRRNSLVALNAGALPTATLAADRRGAGLSASRAAATATAEVAMGTAGLRSAARRCSKPNIRRSSPTFKPDYPDMVRLRSKIEALDARSAAEAGTCSRAAGSTALLADYPRGRGRGKAARRPR